MALILSPAAAHADTITPDAPDIASGPSAVGARVYQLEQSIQSNFSAAVPSLTFPSLHRYGLGDGVELRLKTPVLSLGAGSVSRADIALGGKWNLAQVGLPGWLPPLALLGAVNVDAANALEPSFGLLTDIALPMDLSLIGNAGGSFPATGPAFTYVASLSRGLIPRWQMYAEVAGSWEPTGLSQTGVDGGLMYLLDDDTQLAASVYTDVAQPFGSWYVATNYSHRWAR